MGNWVRNVLKIKGDVMSLDFFEKTSRIAKQHEFKILERTLDYTIYSFGSNGIPCFNLVWSFSYNYPDLTFILNYYEMLDDIMGKTIYRQGDILHEEVYNFEHYGIRNPFKYQNDFKEITKESDICHITVSIPLKKLLES